MSPLFVLLSSGLLSSALALAQDGPPPSDLEGALRNDTFLPVSNEVVTKLAAGDAAWARWRAAPVRSADAAGSRNEAFDGWRRALTTSRAGDSVPGSLTDTGTDLSDTWPDPDATLARRTEAIECAVLRRLAQLDAADLTEWCQRFDALARRELTIAGSDDTRLSQVERQHPCTAAAAEAALRLFDIAFESGRREVARGWLDRVGVHARGLERAGMREPSATLTAALARRRETLERTEPPRVAGGAWETAERLSPVATIALATLDEGATGAAAATPRPGVAYLTDGTLVVQCAERVHCISREGQRRHFDLASLGRSVDWTWEPVAGGRAADWPLTPASDGKRLVLVAGRAELNHGNALLCVDPGSAQNAPTLLWGYSSSGWRDPLGRQISLEECLGPGLWSFEPGPAVAGSEVVVQARQWIAEADGEVRVDEGRTRAWCLVLDLANGAVRWKRFLASGSDARTDPTLLARLRSASGLVGCAQPVGLLEGRIFIGTELGVGVLLDLCDGRPLWSIRSQRRERAERGWTTTRPPLSFAGDDAVAEWLWAPADSKFLYRLRNAPDLDGRGLFQARPTPIGDLDEIVGAGRTEVIALARAADRRTLTRLDTSSGRREDSVLLGRDEVFTGAGLASAARVLFATSRALHLVDRARGLYLVQSVALPGQLGAAGGSVYARGDLVYVVHPRSLTILRAE